MGSHGKLEKVRPAGAYSLGGRDMRLCLGSRSGETLLGKVPLSGTGSPRHNDVACGCFVFLSRFWAHCRWQAGLSSAVIRHTLLARLSRQPFRSQHGSRYGHGPFAVRHLHRQHGPVLLPPRALSARCARRARAMPACRIATPSGGYHRSGL